VAIGV
jgi:hypothetical protein